jgi:hypothetical protein
MIVAMSETPTSSSEPPTSPVAGPPQAQPVVRDEPRRSRVTAAAAWVGIVAGVVFIVAVIFFSGFVLGSHSGGHRGHDGHRGDQGSMMFHRGPPPMFQMGPRGQFGGPGMQFGPGGPGSEAPSGPSSGPQSPAPTSTMPRP